MISHAPTIYTDRLVLRGHLLDDFPEVLTLWSDPAVTRHIGGRPFTGEEVWQRLHRYVGHWALLGFGFWVAIERTSHRFVGEVGLADFHREVAPSFDGAPEVGWVLQPWAHGQGFATEAVQAALIWGEATLGMRRSVCMIDPDNVSSIRVAEKCGFREWVRTTYKGEPAILFER